MVVASVFSVVVGLVVGETLVIPWAAVVDIGSTVVNASVVGSLVVVSSFAVVVVVVKSVGADVVASVGLLVVDPTVDVSFDPGVVAHGGGVADFVQFLGGVILSA